MAEPAKFVTGKDVDGIPNGKTGTVATASLHCFCAIVGAGVLALPYAVAWLGWIAGPTLMLIFYLISLLTSILLAEVYEVDGVEHGRYYHAVRHLLGKASAVWVSMFQLLNLFLITIAYTITAATSMRHIADLACLIEGKEQGDCWHETWKLTLIFGAVEMVLSQIRNLEEAWWVSAVGSATSITYSLVALIISLVHSGNREGNVQGISASSAGKAFGVLNALGTFAFAYSFSVVLLEIEDTLRQPPRAATQMKKACHIAITGSFLLYVLVAIAGYLARGNDVSGMILASYDSPRWAIILANVCVVLHMVTAYQVFAQPMFDTIESWVETLLLRRQAQRAKKAEDAAHEAAPPVAVHDGAAPAGVAAAASRVALRAAYVAVVTLLAVVMPFFSSFVGLVGALTFFPLAVYFPIACYRKVHKVGRWFNLLLWVIWWSMLVVSCASTVAACRNIIMGWSNYKVFGD